MIAGATPLIASPLGLPTAAEPATPRADENAKSEFAAMLTAMMNPAKVAPAPVRVTLDAVADATTTDESMMLTDEETETANGTVANTAPEAAATTTRAVGDVISSTALLDPEFATRLQRVMDRMRDAGHTVEVRETLRTPERQDALYAQGRTTSGPVVTWTRESRHIEGKAADVVVDGRASGKGYAVLHRIADEEGLRTLGARDPGHLELPRTTVDATDGAAARRGSSDDMVRPLRQGGMLAAPARVARVAEVAQIAQAAAPARVAVPGLSVGNGYSQRAATSVDTAQRVAARNRSEGSSREGAIRSGLAIDGATFVRGDDRTATIATATAAARVAVERAATVVGLSVDARRSAAAADQSVTRGANTASDPLLATVPTDATGFTSAERAGGDGSQQPSRDGSGDASTEARDERALARQDARAASLGRGARTQGESERESARDVADARPARQTRGRAASALAAFANEVTARSSFDPMRESTALTGARLGDFGGSAPIIRTGGLAAERVAELLAARDARPAGALSELRLAMDPVRDGLSEVRLALQNGALDATLRTADAGIARGLQGEVATLTRSLERQGFDAARVSVQLDAAQQARATALDTVAASEASARARALRGDSDASLEGREQQTAPDSGREQSREQQREQQHARQFGTRRQRQF